MLSLTERERHDAYEALSRAFGEQTDKVIAMLQTDTDRFVTKDEFRVAMARIDSQFVELGAELRSEFRNEIHTAFGAQTRTLVIALVGAFLLTAVTNVLTLVLG